MGYSQLNMINLKVSRMYWMNGWKSEVFTYFCPSPRVS